MALVPEYKWPDGPGYLNLADDDKIMAGYECNNIFLFRDIIEIDMSGLSPSVHYDNPVMLYKFTLDNDVELRLYAWYDTLNSLYAAVWKAFYDDVEFTAEQYRQSGLNTGETNEINDSSFIEQGSYYKTGTNIDVPWKLVVQTLYAVTNPVENVTPATGFGFILFGASHRNVQVGTEWVDLRNDLESIQPGVQLTYDNLVNIPYEDDVYRVDYNWARWLFLNLNTTSTYMKTAGKGTNKNITGGSNQDPEAPEDDTSGTGGGGGVYDPTSDPVDFPSLPTGGALTSGMIKGFVIGQGNLIALQQKLWNMSIFDIETQFQKLVQNPLECLISLHCLPCLPTTGNVENIKLGSFDTEVTGNRITNQYLTVDAGTLNVPKYWGSALDYAPFTRAEIFLPFIGIRNLQIEDIQGLTLTLKYHVDVLTGDCVAYIKCGNSVLYTFTGNCIQHIPCTATSSDLLAKNISAVGMVGVGIATGNPAAAVAGAAAGAINSATAKNHVQRSGEVAGSPGVMSDFTPYMIFHRPKQSLAKNYNKFKGYPTNITYTLNTLTGYTEVEHVHLTGIKATDTELQEIENLLKSGVII